MKVKTSMKKKITISFILTLVISLMFLNSNVMAISYNIDFDTQSRHICIGNIDTDSIVYTKDADSKLEPASTTKIMTYIVVAEHCPDLDGTMVTVTKEITSQLMGTESSIANLKNGEIMSMYEMLNCMMVPSGNDAAMVMANFIGNGKISAFVDMMNDKAKELGCEDTHFVNPDGLHDDNHYTTANDMYKIAKYAMTLPRFMEICSQTVHKIPQTNMQPERKIYTTNEMMQPNSLQTYYQYTKGIKTGWHDQAGRCIVSSATADGYTYLCVSMGAPNDKVNNGAMIDSKNLYRWAFKNLELKTIAGKEQPVTEVKINMAWQKDSMLLVPEKDVAFLLPKTVNAKSVSFSDIDVPKSINAPVKKGDVVGTATITYANQELTKVNLVAGEDINRSSILFAENILKIVFTSPWFIIISVLIALLVILYIYLTKQYNKKEKKNKRVKRYRRF
jgi:D-alanyl-D-alanine carboxypeptidase (penicillin-binding protein 5/6)